MCAASSRSRSHRSPPFYRHLYSRTCFPQGKTLTFHPTADTTCALLHTRTPDLSALPTFVAVLKRAAVPALLLPGQVENRLSNTSHCLCTRCPAPCSWGPTRHLKEKLRLEEATFPTRGPHKDLPSSWKLRTEGQKMQGSGPAAVSWGSATHRAEPPPART